MSDKVLKISKGSIPKVFLRIVVSTEYHSFVTIITITSSNPGAILLLPVTIVVDVFTLPVQIPVIMSMSKIH